MALTIRQTSHRPALLGPRGDRPRVLNVGCGDFAPNKLHGVFDRGIWDEIRLDIDPKVKPDLIGSVTDMHGMVPDGAFDGIYSSHNIEHLHSFEVGPTLREFHRVLRPDGFALITCPDLTAVAQMIVDGKLMEVIYEAPAGPIRAVDMLYGHQRSVERGNHYMMHNTGLTQQHLGEMLATSGFHEVLVRRGSMHDLWALALKERALKQRVIARLKQFRLDFSTA